MTEWLDEKEYPFAHRFLDLPMGRMHYVDEGTGDHAVVMVHGNPAWSFAYRKLIQCLSKNYRCIAPDHIGFGLSDKPPDWDYLPESHARNFEQLLEHLGLRSITLVVGDWGGPIGLSYAISHPEKVKSIVLTNTWMWSVKGVLHYEMFSRLMGGFIGRFLIRKYNFFVKVLMKSMFRCELEPAVHRHYIEPLKRPEDRKGCWTFPNRITGSSDWLAGLWKERPVVENVPTLIAWGKRDIAFRDIELRKWKTVFKNAEIREFDRVGHLVQEVLGEELCPLVEDHMKRAAP